MTVINTNTLSSMNSMFKVIQADAENLLPMNAVLLNEIPKLADAEIVGQSFNMPVQASWEQGMSFGDTTGFQLNAAVAAVYLNAQVLPLPMVLVSQVSLSALNRMLKTEKTFITESALRAEVMYQSHARFVEIAMLYGQSGLGITTTASSGSGTTATIQLTQGSWSSGIWCSAINALVQFYNGSTQISGSGGANSVDSQFQVTAANATAYQLTVTGTTSGITALNTAITANALNIFWNGAYTNEMPGLDYQITAASNSLSVFGISGATYPLWAGNIYNCNNTSLTFQKILAGTSLAVSVGGLDVEALLMVNALTFSNLVSDQAGQRVYDDSYSGKEFEQGSEGLKFHGPNGVIKVKINNITKLADAHLVPKKRIKRVGTTEITFKRPGSGEGDYFQEMPGYAYFILRTTSEFWILLERPAQAVKFTNIQTSN